MPDLLRFGPWLASRSPRLRGVSWIGIGALTALGQAPVGWYPATLLGLALAALGLSVAETRKKGFWAGWLLGLGYFAVTLSWIIEPFLVDVARHGWMAPFALIGMAGGLALFWGLASALSWSRRVPHWLAWPLAMTVAELARAYVFTGFPWGMLAYVWLETPLLQFAALIGPHGLTLLTLLLVTGALQFGRWAVIALPLGAVLTAAIGMLMTPPLTVTDPAQPMVRLIQPNAEQHLKWDPDWVGVFFERSLEMTHAESARQVDLIVWPETSVPLLLEEATSALLQMSDAASGRPVIAGALRFKGPRLFNTLIALDSDGALSATYDKHHLVPFGEYFPGGDLLAGLGIHGWRRGKGRIFTRRGSRLVGFGSTWAGDALICYEAVFPQDVNNAPKRADWIIQITNDAWFGKISGPHQHLAQARFRAVEQGLPMVRVANTGISAMIDPAGRLRGQIALGTKGFVDVLLPEPRAETLYSRYGELPLFLVLLGLTFALVMTGRRNSD